ncbi:alpha-1,4-N-acetylglucosaminyltransferase, partial [Nephila pilipes]
KHHCIDNPVFFVETSGSNILTPRQACAVESTARHNPSLKINVLMTPINGINSNDVLIRKLRNISNIQIIDIKINELVCETPIWNWYVSGKWKKSKWKASHLSDALRFFLIWKYGGIYLDMDIVTLRSLEHLKNSAITENWERVASGILIFDKKHELMRRCMFDFAANYDSSNFVVNGPGTITRNIKSFCDIDNIGKVSGANCHVDIQPPTAAFPIPYDKWEEYFTPTSLHNISKIFNSSYLIHVWNKYSKFSKLKVGMNSLYELAMKEHCPSVHKYIQQVGYA